MRPQLSLMDSYSTQNCRPVSWATLRRLVGPLNLKPRLQLGAAVLRPALFRSPAAIDGRMNCVPKQACCAFYLNQMLRVGGMGPSRVEGAGLNGPVVFGCCYSFWLHRYNPCSSSPPVQTPLKIFADRAMVERCSCDKGSHWSCSGAW